MSDIKYKRNVDIIASDLNEEKVMMNILNGNYYSVNEVGSRIWEILEKPHSMEEIVTMLLAEFDVDEETCRSEVNQFISELNDNDLLEQAN